MKTKFVPDMSKAKYLTCDIQFRKTKGADGQLYIEGYANTVDKDRVNDVVIPEAFKDTLETYQKNPILLFQHDWDKVIGRVVSAKLDDKGLYIKALISSSDDCKDIRVKIKEKILTTFSIGYNELDSDYNEATKTNLVKKVELLEISVVTIPANINATFVTSETEIQQNTETTGGQKSMQKFEESQKPFEGIVPKTLQEKVKPAANETEGEYISRSIPILMEEGYPQDQAIAIAYSMWRESQKGTELPNDTNNMEQSNNNTESKGDSIMENNQNTEQKTEPVQTVDASKVMEVLTAIKEQLDKLSASIAEVMAAEKAKPENQEPKKEENQEKPVDQMSNDEIEKELGTIETEMSSIVE